MATVVLTCPAGAHAAAVNGKIAFIRAADIYVMNADGANKTNLTDSKALEEQATFSPDGQRIAFVRTPLEGFISTGESDVYVINADGSGRHRITDVGSRIESVVWSADGTRIFYLADRDQNRIVSELYSIGADGTGEVQLSNAGPSIDFNPTLSTAADKITFASNQGATSSEIYVINTDGSGLLRLTDDPGFDDGPVISPDATRIAWTTDRHNPPDTFDTSSEIYAINADGSNQQRLTTGPRIRNVAVAFSPDGSRLGFNRNERVSVMNADGTAPTSFTLSDNFDLFEEFSPDGQRIAFSHVLPLRGEDPHYTVDTVGIDGSLAARLTNKDDDAVYADWQAVTEPPPNPPLELEAEAAKAQGAKSLRATFTCSNECDLELSAKGVAGGRRFASELSPHAYGNEPNTVRALKRRLAKRIDGERGTVTLTVTASDDFGATETAKLTVRLKG